jgi:hypothetical protein
VPRLILTVANAVALARFGLCGSRRNQLDRGGAPAKRRTRRVVDAVDGIDLELDRCQVWEDARVSVACLRPMGNLALERETHTLTMQIIRSMSLQQRGKPPCGRVDGS